MSPDDLTGGGTGQTPIHPEDLDGLLPRHISTQGELDELERENVLTGTVWALRRRRTLASVLQDVYLRELHRRCFGGVWSWAGTYRTRATSIGIDAFKVASAVRDLMLDAALWFDATGDLAGTDEALARLHYRVVAIHPFANGNGRTGRLYTDVVARAVGAPPLSWGRQLPDTRGTYLQALRSADAGDLRPLTEYLRS
jgi:Fic-DOC domain mobile mystery protein B